MNRTPWRSRMFLVGLIDAIAGAVIAVAVYLGAAGDVEPVTATIVGITNVLIAVGVTLGVLRDGESETTPVADPLGADLLPLMPFRRLEDLTEAARIADWETVRRILGLESHELADHLDHLEVDEAE